MIFQIDSDNNSGTSSYRFRTNGTADDGTELMRIQENGNVGIGTTTPGAKLQVGTRGTTGALTPPATDGILFDFHNDGSPYTRHAAIISQSGDTTEAVMDFWTKPLNGSNSKKMTLRGDGKLGLGTISPAGRLHVSDNGSDTNILISNTGSGQATVGLDASNGDFSGSDYMVLRQNNDLSGDITMFQSAGDFHLRSQISGVIVSALTMQRSTGNIGIGSTSPLAELDVAGTARMDTGITEGIHYVGTGLEHWGDGGTGMAFPANDILSLRTASSDRLYINATGNVGIGTTSPNAKLQVEGALKTRNMASGTTNTAVRRMINVASYDRGGSTDTGKLIIETPVMTTGAMATFKISGWQYDESWDLTVSGYLRFGTGRGWEQIGGAILTGNPPFDIDEVRLCYNDTTNIFYIILGDASTFWDYYASIVIDADSYYQDSIPTIGWNITINTADPTGLTDIVTLTNISKYGSNELERSRHR